MLPPPASATKTISEGRDARRQQLVQTLRGAADALVERLADELVDLPDDQCFGAIEHTLRDLGHDFTATAHQAGLEASKKRGTTAPVASAPSVPPTPASSVIGPKAG